MSSNTIEQRARAAPLDCQRRVLERIANGAPLAEILETLVKLIEDQAEDMRCAVLLTDSTGQRLQFVAAPNIPADYKTNIEPFLQIAPGMVRAEPPRSAASLSIRETPATTPSGRTAASSRCATACVQSGRRRFCPTITRFLGRSRCITANRVFPLRSTFS